jgi:hypothetical protein
MQYAIRRTTTSANVHLLAYSVHVLLLKRTHAPTYVHETGLDAAEMSCATLIP